ncbi:hypothetical protein QJQ45_016590, partial [Haematococcus lacustris]
MLSSPNETGVEHQYSTDRLTNNLSWLLFLQSYLRTSSSADGPSAQRKALADVVMENPASAEAWADFLQSEEAAAVEAAKQPSHRLALYKLYHKATELIQRGKGRVANAYMRVWLGYARHQWEHNEDEARDTLKTLKNQHIGDSAAHLYHLWATLESKSGYHSKALAILNKAIKDKAQPLSVLEDLLAQMHLSSGPSPPSTTPSIGPLPLPPPPGVKGVRFAVPTTPRASGSHPPLPGSAASSQGGSSTAPESAEHLYPPGGPGSSGKGVSPDRGLMGGGHRTPHSTISMRSHSTGRSSAGSLTTTSGLQHSDLSLAFTNHTGKTNVSASDEDATITCTK